MSIVLGALLSGLLASSGAATPTASATVVINGKTVSLAHGRAWKNGVTMGLPIVDIIIAEKSLAGLNWWKGTDNFAEGQRGVALRFKPSNAPTDQAGQATFRYVFAEDYEISLYSGDFGAWNEKALSKDAVKITDLSVTKDVVSGKLEWQGNLENPFETSQKVSAWSATFSLPLEDVGPMPAQ